MRIRGEGPGAAWSDKLHILALTTTKIRYDCCWKHRQIRTPET